MPKIRGYSQKRNRSAHRLFPDGSRFLDPLPDMFSECVWQDCTEPPLPDIPVCLIHGVLIHHHIGMMLEADRSRFESLTPMERERRSFVYYLMVGPATVKIGVTQNLVQRLQGLRSNLQYVVAIEPGTRALELQRHKQFDTERIMRHREDFHLSERLRRHIDSLIPQRDDLIRLATADYVARE